jgi:XTP/dITP diphosphohydrolase
VLFGEEIKTHKNRISAFKLALFVFIFTARMIEPVPPIPIIVATRNRHKVLEIQNILGDAFVCLGAEKLPDIPAIIEDAASFRGNATKKSIELAFWIIPRLLKLSAKISRPDFVLADDSGLEVDALDGAPGVHSARFAALDSDQAGNSSDSDNNSKLLRLLGNLPIEKRTARFRCVLALVPISRKLPQNIEGQTIETDPKIFEGVCEGRITLSSRGQNGFGYDPLFVPDGFTESFAELGEDVKNKISHRAKALQKLREYLDSLRS